MARKFIFFINPVSGTRSKLHLERKIVGKCDKQGFDYEIMFTSKEGDYGFLYEKITDENVTDIAIAGGDGSIRPIIAASLNLPVRIGIIPAGSGNGLARTAGIPSNIDKAIDLILNGDAFETDAFLINDQLSAHVCGLGFDAKVAHDFSVSKNRGLNSYTKIAIRNFRNAKTFPFIVEVDGKCLETEAFLIAIANSNQFGNNFKLAPQASISDGLLDVVIVKKTNKATAVLSFVKQILQGKLQNFHSSENQKENILYFQTSRLSIQNLANAPFHIDGDPAATAKEFLIEILPAAFKLIRFSK
jgi:YegS/Rv2252/BmrU family lipid kinase